MQKQNLTKIFKLEDYVIDNIEYFDDEIRIWCHSRSRGMSFDGKYSNKYYETKLRIVSHMMLEDKPVNLYITQRRFSFSKKRIWEKLPGVAGKQRATKEFKKNTLRELHRDNYSASGFKRNKSGMYTSKLLDKLEIPIMWPDSVTRIGLDGKYVKKRQLVHHLTDLDHGKSITVLPNLTKEQLKKNS